MEGRGLYVGRLPVGATDAKLVQAFARFGKIQHILNKYWQGFAFIRFEDASSVDRVLVEPVHMIDGQVCYDLPPAPESTKQKKNCGVHPRVSTLMQPKFFK